MERTTRMGISVVDAVKEIQARDSIFVAYSQVTKLPYVTCAEETYNDQAWFFAEEETLKEFGKKKLDDKILLMGMKYEKKDFPRMYGLLYASAFRYLFYAGAAPSGKTGGTQKYPGTGRRADRKSEKIRIPCCHGPQ